MANICSTYLQIYPWEAYRKGQNHANIGVVLTELLEGTDGYSYCTPVYANFGKHGKYLEVAFGERHSPHSLFYFFEKYQDEIAIIFYRFYADGGHYDGINCLYHEEYIQFPAKFDAKQSRLCRYGFDTIRFQTNVDLSRHTIQGYRIKSLGDKHYEVHVKGSYCSENEFCDILKRSSFNNYQIDDLARALGFSDLKYQKLSTEHFDLLCKIQEIAVAIQYFYKDKMVFVAIRKTAYVLRGFSITSPSYKKLTNLEGWLYFPFDSWYNCVDERYLYYLQHINFP